jgi:tetratricopeptide (TPR) repeat protein
MTRRLATVLLGLVVLSSCAEIRLSRLGPALEDDIRAGRMADAAQKESEMLGVADRGFGAQSVDATRARVALARSYAQWKLTDRAIALARETVDRLDPVAADQAIVVALLGLADIQLYAQRWEEAERTTDRLLGICNAAPPHAPTADDLYDECHFARYEIDNHYLNAGAYRKFAREYLSWDEASGDPPDREAALSKLAVLGRGFARYGAYPEAIWYFQRCVDENRLRYERRAPPPPARHVAGTASRDVEVFTLDWAHSFHSQSPRCLEDLIEMRRLVGDDRRATDLERWQRELWQQGPDLEAWLLDSMRKSDRTWHDGYNTSHDANNLAFYYAGKGRTHDAIRLYRQAIALIDAQREKDGVFGAIHPTGMLLDELTSLGAECEKAGLTGDALEAWSRAMAIADRELHPRHTWRLASRAGRARSLARLGRSREAESAWREYLETARSMRGSEHPDYATGLDGLAGAIADRDRREAKRLRQNASNLRSAARSRVAAARDLPLPVALRSPAPPAN